MRSATAIVLTLGLSAVLLAQVAPANGTLLVLAKSDLTLSVVDPTTLKVLGQVPSGPDPHEVIASTDGRTAYISNYGGGSLNTITVVDLVERKALPPIDLGALRGPHGLTFVDGKLWFTAEGAKVVARYDPATREIDLVLGTGQNRTHMIFVSGDGKRVVTSNVSSATMTILDLVTAGARAGASGTGGGREPRDTAERAAAGRAPRRQGWWADQLGCHGHRRGPRCRRFRRLAGWERDLGRERAGRNHLGHRCVRQDRVADDPGERERREPLEVHAGRDEGSRVVTRWTRARGLRRREASSVEADPDREGRSRHRSPAGRRAGVRRVYA